MLYNLSRNHIVCTWTLFAFANFISDCLILVESCITLSLDLRMVNEQIVAAIFRCNETKTLTCIEPFYCTCTHTIRLLGPFWTLKLYLSIN